MKGIFIMAAAFCLGACAAQPERSAATNLDTAQAPVSGVQQTAAVSKRVYLEDYERVNVQAGRLNRTVLVLDHSRK